MAGAPDHLGDLDGQCPMIALPSDVGRAGPEVQAAYLFLLEAMVALCERAIPSETADLRANMHWPWPP